MSSIASDSPACTQPPHVALPSSVELSWDDAMAGRFPARQALAPVPHAVTFAEAQQGARTSTMQAAHGATQAVRSGVVRPTEAPEPISRRVFRLAVAEVTLALHEELPKTVKGRITQAAKIVLAGDIIPCHNGDKFVVGSQSDAGLDYVVDNQCGCKDAERPEIATWCKHKIASVLYVRATALGAERMAALDTPTPKGPRMEDEIPEPTPEAPRPAPAPEPYAPSTLCLKASVAGVEMSWTLRGDDADVAERAKRVLSYLDKLRAAKAPEAPPVGTSVPATPTCALHGTEKMQPSKFGTNVWICGIRLDDGSFCNKRWQGPKS